jgi:hypothetical protein
LTDRDPPEPQKNSLFTDSDRRATLTHAELRVAHDPEG